MTAYRRPVEPAALAQNFLVFANECASEPLYGALSRAIAGDRDILDLLLEAPYPQRRPVLLFAATHDLLLAGADHPLARFYRSVAGESGFRGDVDHAFAAFADFCGQQREALLALLRERTMQTNEVGRCAALRLVLAGLDRRTPIALIDVGCSAGLNLLVDRYRFVYRLPDKSLRTIGSESPVVIPAAFEGDDAFSCDLSSMPAIAGRFGIDLALLDVRDARDTRWLQACVWPSEVERHARLAGAIELAREMRRSTEKSTALDLRRGNANDLLSTIVDGIDGAVRPVVFHSWVVSYFEREARTRFAEEARAIVVERDGVWISAEAAGVVPGLAAPALADDPSPARREATLWHVTTRNADGACEVRTMARTHPHCRWIEWLGFDPPLSFGTP